MDENVWEKSKNVKRSKELRFVPGRFNALTGGLQMVIATPSLATCMVTSIFFAMLSNFT
jgi:hypothetical protein